MEPLPPGALLGVQPVPRLPCTPTCAHVAGQGLLRTAGGTLHAALCLHECTLIHSPTCAHTCTHHTYVHACTHTANTRMCTLKHTPMHAHTHAHVHTPHLCLHTHIHAPHTCTRALKHTYATLTQAHVHMHHSHTHMCALAHTHVHTHTGPEGGAAQVAGQHVVRWTDCSPAGAVARGCTVKADTGDSGGVHSQRTGDPGGCAVRAQGTRGKWPWPHSSLLCVNLDR